MSRAWWIATVCWLVLIEVLTTVPHPPTFGAPSGSDKVAHAALYGVLGFLVMRATHRARPSPRSALAVLMALLVWGALDEWHQMLIPSRSATVGDWVADAVGAALGILAGTLRAPPIESRSA